MGISDRDYYRDPEPSFWDRIADYRATTFLIAITCALFLLQLVLGNPRQHTDPLQTYGSFQGSAILAGEVWRLLTTNFVQHNQAFFSVLFGMLFLYWAGNELETANYGTKRFFYFYVIAGIVISLAKLVAVLLLDGQAGDFSGGSSLPVLAVLVLFACHYPHRTILLFFIIPMPIWLLASLIVGFATLSLYGRGENLDLVGVWSAAAFAYSYYRTRGFSSWDFLYRRPGKPQNNYTGWDNIPTFPVAPSPSRVNSASETGSNTSNSEDNIDFQLDEVLAKVARTGRESLSQEELALLMRASEIYKRRRS